MKRFFSLFLSVILMLTLAVPALGAETVKFKVTVVSENATQAVVTIDYDGGSSFSCLDLEIALSSKLTVVSGGQSAGLKAFRDYADDKGGAAIGAFNTESKPIKSTFATTVPYEAVNGKDLYKLTLKKSTADKITKNDVKVTITNCGILKNGGDIVDLSPSIAYAQSSYVAPTKPTTKTTTKATTKTTKKTDASKQTTTKASETTKAGETTTLTEATTVAGETTTLEFYTLGEMVTEDVIGTLEDNDNELEKSKEQAEKDKKKIILIGVGAACCVIVIAGVLIYVVKKAKKEESMDE